MPKQEEICEDMKRCKNKPMMCWNCERNMENDVLEDNFEEKEPKHPKLKLDKRFTPNTNLKHPNIEKWANSIQTVADKCPQCKNPVYLGETIVRSKWGAVYHSLCGIQSGVELASVTNEESKKK